MWNLEAFVTTFGPAFKDAATGCAAIAGVYVAWRGLQTWRRQLKGTAEYDLARRLLKATYKLRDALHAARVPVMWAAEMPPPPPDVAEGKDEPARMHWSYTTAYQKRWDVVVAAATTAQAELLEAEVLWGVEARAPLTKVFRLQAELFANISARVAAEKPNMHPAERDLAEARLKAVPRHVAADHSTDDAPDAYRQDLLNAVGEVEQFVRPHLNRSSESPSFLERLQCSMPTRKPPTS